MKPQERILLIGAGFWWLGEGLFGPLFAVFAGKVGGSVLDIAWAWAIYLLVTGGLEVFIGRISDKIGHAKLMVAGYALNAVFTFGYLFVHDPAGLFIVQAGLGVALALADPTWDALYAKHEDRRSAGRIWGLEHGTEELITGASIFIGGFIVSYFSFTTLFAIMGVIQVVGALYQAKILYFDR
ncbi:MAG: MFS transporter [Patescibacteria group bacterium]|nr:MFS transporter [Patescibacteria group bacterium]